MLGGMATGETGTAQRRGIGWWVRTALMLVVPLVIAWLGRSNPPLVVAGVWLIAQFGAVYLFHPDTLGWRLSAIPSFVADRAPAGPSEAWRVRARLMGVFLVGACLIGVLAIR